MKQQNDHWYAAVGGGWTADPQYAKPGEVDRIGLHVCEIQYCEETHSCNAQEFEAKRIAAYVS